jgi:RNA polymerase sigma factor (sigma-70 family)
MQICNSIAQSQSCKKYHFESLYHITFVALNRIQDANLRRSGACFYATKRCVVRVGLVADDDAYFRMAVVSILKQRLGFSDVEEAASLDEALAKLAEMPTVEAALFDLSMPGMNTPTNLRSVRNCIPGARLAVVSGSQNKNDILLSLQAGAHGYIPKSFTIPELTSALTSIFDGQIYVPPLLADLEEEQTPVPEEHNENAEGANAISSLTPRQREVLELLIKGKSNKEIARILDISRGTIKIHLNAIFRHFGVTNRAAAAVAGTRYSL